MSVSPGDDRDSIYSKSFIHSSVGPNFNCLLYTSDAADENRSVDLGGRRIIKKIFIF